MLTTRDEGGGRTDAAQGDGLEERISALLRADLGLVVPSVDAELLDSGILDSLAIVELVVRLEEAFGIRLDMARLDLTALRSVRAIAGLVRSGTSQNHSSRG